MSFTEQLAWAGLGRRAHRRPWERGEHSAEMDKQRKDERHRGERAKDRAGAVKRGDL